MTNVFFQFRSYPARMTATPHEKIVGFDITMNKVFRVNILHPSNHLISQHQYSLHTEAARTGVK